jgi:class 3 adenylate cyclase/tetratricopeptide (TPR) repeat protein
MTVENLTILYTDMVGSTELSQRLSAEAADEVRRGHFSILRQAIAECGGTEVKGLGDGLMVVFSSASAALSCGVAMQQGVELDNRNRDYPVGLRAGLSGGEVTKEEDDYFGDPAIEAARLCAACEGGQVLATETLRRMAGRRNRHEWRSLGELNLKGLPPLETVEVLWDPLDGADAGTIVPFPARLSVRPAVGVVGRETETSAMTSAAKRVAAGEGREVLLVSGEAGMGKTTLVAEAARSTFDDGACVLFGHCEENLATPYQLFAEALAHYVTHAPEDQLLAHVAGHGSELSRLVPALASRIPDLPPSKATDSDTDRFLLFAAVVGLLATAHQPVVLVLDDLQWADKGSLLLLRHLTAAEHTMRLLILGSYRHSELSSSHPLLDTLADLHRQNGVSRIELAGLDDTGVVALMEAVAGYTLDAAAIGLAHAVYRETDGNPFFVGEVLRHLSETGAIYQDATGRWVAEDSPDQIALPDSVRVVITARVGRLGRDAERVLSTASVIGRDFDLDLLARATKTTEDELLDILDAAAAVTLVRELANDPGRYNFAHALIQHTLYADLGPTRRARAHRQVAEALEDLCGDCPGARVGELARHWISATRPIDLAKAIDYSRQAGDAALGALAPADALRHYAQALDLYPQATDPDPVLGIDLAIGLGTAQRQTGDPAFRDTLLGASRRAADLGDTGRLVAAALANDRGVGMLGSGGSATEEVEVCELALDNLPADHPDRALILALLCSKLAVGASFARRQSLAEEALRIAEASSDDFTIVRVLNHIALPLRVPQLLEQSLAWSEEAMARAERIGDPVLTFWSASARLVIALSAGDIEEVDRSLDISGLLANQLDQPMLNWARAVQLGTRAQIAGDTDRAEDLANEALQIGTDGGEPDALVVYLTQLLAVSWQRGTLGDLVPLVEKAVADGQGVPALAAALALAYVEADDLQKAHDILEQPASGGFDFPLRGAWLTEMVLFAEVAAECGDAEAAEVMLGRLESCTGHFAGGGRGAEGPVDHYLARLATLLGRYDTADVYFAQSAAMSQRMGAKYFAARADLHWGRMLSERHGPGDIEKALDLLTKAHNAAAAYGYGGVERRAAAALQGLG